MIEDEFKNEKFEFVGVEDQSKTGNFDVYINGTLVHSKKGLNHGHLHTNSLQQVKVIEFIEKIVYKKGSIKISQ